MNPEVVGEGTYGCVTKPSIKCRGKSIGYDNKVSKIMVREDAMEEYDGTKELSKYKNINKYIIPQPEICKPVINDTFHATVKKCENTEFLETKDEDFLILVQDDGGVSLTTLVEKFLFSFTEHDVHVFLTKIHHLMKGLLYFNKKSIVHHDVASRNVVYNIKTGIIRFIDFGLLQKADTMMKECKKGKNKFAKKWNNFPPENEFANYNKFKMSGFEMDYNLFLKRLVYTFDWFSLGIMMKKILKELYNNTKISTTFFQELNKYFEILGEENIRKRDYNIRDMTQLYKTLLLKHNIWTDQKPRPSLKIVDLQNSLKTVKSLFPQLTLKERENVINALSTKRGKFKKRVSLKLRTKRCVVRRCGKNDRRDKLTKKCVRKKNNKTLQNKERKT